MSLKTISPSQAADLMKQGAVLLDIREANERAREQIPGAQHLPLSALSEPHPHLEGAPAIIFHCRSGMRTQSHAEALRCKAGDAEAYVVEGGLDAWKKAGLPLMTDKRKPIEIQRQVQIGAGLLGLTGTLLGTFVHPAWLIIPGFVGAGLTFAGATGFCGMARILAHAPWNRA